MACTSIPGTDPPVRDVGRVYRERARTARRFQEPSGVNRWAFRHELARLSTAENLERVIATQDAVLLGRRTYDEWSRFWPTRTTGFADFINPTRKFVATSTPLEHGWTNATVIGGEVPRFVAELKHQPGGDIGVHGSIALTQSLLEAGLVDELRLVIAPAIQVRGRKLFEGGVPKRLSVTRNVTSPSGYLLVDLRFEG